MRRATLRTAHRDEGTARLVAAAVRPDNTTEMRTAVDEADPTVVETTVERETTGGLRSTVDDYVVNLQVAVQLAHRDGDPSTSDTTTTTTDTT